MNFYGRWRPCRRDGELLLVGIVAGPFLAGLLIGTVGAALRASSPLDLLSGQARLGTVVTILLAYANGVPAAAASAALAAAAARFREGAGRLRAAFLCGFLVTLVVDPIGLDLLAEPWGLGEVAAVALVSGAITAACSGIVERFGSPLPG
jgi:hypothetical protein